MKHLKKTMALALTMIMVLAMGMSAFAAPEDKIEATSGTITVKNAAKGEKYALYKIFDATISKVEGENEGEADSIAYSYTGELPSQLAAAFEIPRIAFSASGNLTPAFVNLDKDEVIS